MDDIKLFTRCIYPIANLLLSFLVFHLTLHTSNHQRRLLLLPGFLFFAILSFKQSTHLLLLPRVASIWAQSVLLNIMHVLSLFLIEKWPVPDHSNGTTESHRSRLRASYWLWSNPRLIPTTKPSTVKARKDLLVECLFRRLPKLPLFYLINQHLQPRLLDATIGALRSEDVARAALLTGLSDFTLREATVRSYVAVSWVWDNFILMDSLHAVLATVMIVSGLDQPEDWPRLFGGVRNMCGLRSFWSRFWHRLARRSHVNYGRVVTNGITFLGMPGSARVSDTIVAFMAFLISGLSHAAVSRQMGWDDWLDVKWFMLNFVACLAQKIVLETVQLAAARIGCKRELETFEESILGRLLGAFWVFGFFFWSVPLWQFPRLYHGLIRAERWATITSYLDKH
ncbi:hypothetical protein F5Y07DRAFT_406553 [Xylaria sp. FL0933]|nr:hypothetical protein F5Y07DRAFT_406553 [Xylaria sp. FL0933]